MSQQSIHRHHPMGLCYHLSQTASVFEQRESTRWQSFWVECIPLSGEWRPSSFSPWWEEGEDCFPMMHHTLPMEMY